MMYDGLIIAYNHQQNGLVHKQPTSPEYMVSQCTDFSSPGLDSVFNQETPYKYPALIISNDIKRINQSADIYQKYMDVIVDDCGNRFNTRNLNSAGSDLQAGYSANIDLDSHLKNINYYTDKCYYDNWKLSPKSEIPSCNGLKHNSQILTPDYTPVGRDYSDCIDLCKNTNDSKNTVARCWNTPPTDMGCDPDIRKRYDFKHAKLQGASCIKPDEWQYFTRGPAPDAAELSKYPNGKRNQEMIDSLNKQHKSNQNGGNGANNSSEVVEHEYYKFFQGPEWGVNNCVSYPNQRLFNNITKRSMLPNHHFRNSDPVYRS
jgi:hypothetical protein